LSSSTVSSTNVTLAAFVDLAVLDVLAALRAAVGLAATGFAAYALVAVVLTVAGLDAVAFGAAAALAADAFVVPVAAAVRADAVRDTDLFTSVSSTFVAVFAVDVVVFVILADFAVGFSSFSSAGSSFFAPRRAGAFLRTPDLGGDAGGLVFVCARCARVRTMLCENYRVNI
jgi:hypothetical protein